MPRQYSITPPFAFTAPNPTVRQPDMDTGLMKRSNYRPNPIFHSAIPTVPVHPFCPPYRGPSDAANKHLEQHSVYS